ncbi:ArnT family glycosyltransferase [Chitinophaga skermanii]|nr:glycosyltransferase family 39 protein [Chitinophaga skermanii]
MKNLLIVLVAAILFIPFLGSAHLFDWDEINFAECAREMLYTHNYSQVQIDFQPFWEKPPLFIWLQVLSMKVFGVNEFAARFPNAVVGIATLLILFNIGRRLIDEKFGFWWMLLYAGSWLPGFYFKSGIIDPTFNLFIFLAIYFAYMIRYTAKPNRAAILSGVFLGLAVLTKGPVAILVALLVLLVYWVYNKFNISLTIKQILLITAFTAVTTLLWFGYEIVTHGWWFVNEFVAYQVRLLTTGDAGHDGPFFYHWIVLLTGCFPASIFLLTYLQNIRSKSVYLSSPIPVKDFSKWMWILFWVVLLLFSIVKTKIVHYSSLCYFPLTYLAAIQVQRLTEGRFSMKKWTIILLLLIGVLLGIAIGSLPLVGIYKNELIPYIGDKFAVANLQADVPWAYWEMIFGWAYVLVVIICGVLLWKKKIQQACITIFVGTLLMMQITMAHFVPKIEGYSQAAAIEFFQQFQGKDVYVQALDYHSYAKLFYTKKVPPSNKNYYDRDWLLNGNVDKPTYFICRITDAAPYLTHPNLEKIGEKNGFVFFQRKPVAHP